MTRAFTNRKSGFIQRGGSMRRQTLWVKIAETVTTLGSANTAVLFTGYSADILALRPFTIVRTHLFFAAGSDQQGADESWQTAIGMAIVTDEAAGVGVTAVPTAFLDASSDAFFLWAGLAGRFEFQSGVGVENLTLTMKDVDSKAMRKVEDGFDIATTIEASSLSNGVTVTKFGRQLIKLH